MHMLRFARSSSWPALIFAGLMLFWGSTPVLAQDEGTTPGEDPIVQLLTLVRWGGVATSVVVIFVAYWVLRITDRIVTGLGETFTDRRLFLQKVATFFRFGVYIGSFLLVFFLSFEVDDRLLTVLGGTAAVALGFALKDLVASVVAGVMIMFERPFQVERAAGRKADHEEGNGDDKDKSRQGREHAPDYVEWHGREMRRPGL